MTYDPQTVLDALRALLASLDGSVPYERGEITWDDNGGRRFAVRVAGYAFDMFSRCEGESPRVARWSTPTGVIVDDGGSLAILNDTAHLLRSRLDTNFGLRAVSAEESAEAWRAAIALIHAPRLASQDHA